MKQNLTLSNQYEFAKLFTNKTRIILYVFKKNNFIIIKLLNLNVENVLCTVCTLFSVFLMFKINL